LATHGVKETNTPADSKHHEDGKGADEPERHDDILLLTSGAAPAGGLLGAIGVCADVGFAGARVALAAQVAGVLVGVGQDARAVTGAVAGHGLTGGQRGEAPRENASKGSSVVVGLVGGGVRGQGSLEVRSGLCGFSDQGSLLDVALLMGETIVGAECILCGGLWGGEDEHGVVLADQSLDSVVKFLSLLARVTCGLKDVQVPVHLWRF
jgi:hypothetical protein